MRQIICDRCKAVIPNDSDNLGYIAINLRDIDTGDLVEDNPFEDWDFCDDCLKAIHEFITKKEEPAVKMVPETTAEKFEEVIQSVDAGKKKQRKKPGPHEWDKGKAQALRDAGWSTKAIAEELGVHESTIRSSTIAPEKPKKRFANEWAEHEPDLEPVTRNLMGEKHVEVSDDG